jgi:hypothetical protein
MLQQRHYMHGQDPHSMLSCSLQYQLLLLLLLMMMLLQRCQ